MHGTSGRPRSEPRPWRAGLAVLLLASSATWVVLLWWAPSGLASPDRAGFRLAAPLAAYAVGRAVCHQRPERSLRRAGRRLPVCARCTGLYAGAPAGMLCALVLARRRVGARSRRVSMGTARWVVLAAAAPMAASWLLEWSGLAQPGNAGRLSLALAPGAAAGWVTITALLGLVDETGRVD